VVVVVVIVVVVVVVVVVLRVRGRRSLSSDGAELTEGMNIGLWYSI